MIDINKLKPEIENVCLALPVKRLGLFGSALTGKFTPESDVDVLVVFDLTTSINISN
jgi:predicted nucleotidyltransferase